MTTLDNLTLASMLKEAIEYQDMDTFWWAIDDLEGKHEDASA